MQENQEPGAEQSSADLFSKVCGFSLRPEIPADLEQTGPRYDLLRLGPLFAIDPSHRNRPRPAAPAYVQIQKMGLHLQCLPGSPHAKGFSLQKLQSSPAVQMQVE
jgi:hypothetical protein